MQVLLCYDLTKTATVFSLYTYILIILGDIYVQKCYYAPITKTYCVRILLLCARCA